MLGKTGPYASVAGLGIWQLGADRGKVDQGEAVAVLAAAVDSGVTFNRTDRPERLQAQALGRGPARGSGRRRRHYCLRSQEQSRSNAALGGMLAEIDSVFDTGVRPVYERYFREAVHRAGNPTTDGGMLPPWCDHWDTGIRVVASSRGQRSFPPLGDQRQSSRDVR